MEFPKHPAKGWMRRLRTFLRNRRGVAAIEFAFVFPVMVVLFLGGTALTQGIVIKRKVVLATRALGDLASQDTCISNSEADTLFTAATAIFQPYSTSTMTLTVSSLNVDQNGNATVEWSDRTVNGGARTTGRTVGSSVTLPSGVNTPNTHVILAEGTYTYTPVVGSGIVSAMPLSETLYLRPRRVTQITRQAATCTS